MTLQRLQGEPGIVQYVEVFNTREEYCLIMKRVISAVSLREFINQFTTGHCFIEPFLEFLFKQVVNIMARVHAHGFEHCDLSCNNILVDVDQFLTLRSVMDPRGS